MAEAQGSDSVGSRTCEALEMNREDRKSMPGRTFQTMALIWELTTVFRLLPKERQEGMGLFVMVLAGMKQAEEGWEYGRSKSFLSNHHLQDGTLSGTGREKL